MNQQPEALLHADRLEEMASRAPMRNSDDDDDLKCAAELRRLYAENEALRVQLKHAELAASAEASLVDELQAENEALKAELQEQARVNGMGGERELRLLAENEALRKDAERRPTTHGEPVAFKQFLSDVHTAAGLVAHGKQSKALSERLGEGVMRYLKSTQPTPELVQAARQALEALKRSTPDASPLDDDYAEHGWSNHKKAMEALQNALKGRP